MWNKAKRKKAREYYLENKERCRENSLRWYRRNRLGVLEKQKIWRINNPDENKLRKKKWYQKNRDKILAYHKKRGRRIREELISELGGKCVICGESNKRFLHLDRINGGEHSRQADWIRKHLSEFQILCANHHNEKSCYGEIIWKGKTLKF